MLSIAYSVEFSGWLIIKRITPNSMHGHKSITISILELLFLSLSMYKYNMESFRKIFVKVQSRCRYNCKSRIIKKIRIKLLICIYNIYIRNLYFKKTSLFQEYLKNSFNIFLYFQRYLHKILYLKSNTY